MGMFDVLKLDVNLLPVSDHLKERLSSCQWQTKDLDGYQSDAYIDENGHCYLRVFETELTPEEKKPYPNHKGMLGIIGILTVVNPRYEKQNLNYPITFYDIVDGIFYEFQAFFTDGKLTHIDDITNYDNVVY